MTDPDGFAATVAGDVRTLAELRDAWLKWARQNAPHTPEPDEAWFRHLLSRRRAAADAAESPEPLSFWHFDGVLRASQRTMLDAVTVHPPDPLHLVAPPGAGKTLIGLLLAVRRGTRAVVFAPTTTIQHQWVTQARALAPDPDTVSDDPSAPGDLTVLTYQRVSVPDRPEAFAPLARRVWIDELVQGGRDHADAEAWVDALETTNTKAHRAGIARRAAAVRKRLAAQSPESLAETLHPNARALVDSLVAHGVRTVVLDECHHLLDHWALVIAYLESRIRAADADPLLIGLTATVPSPQDAAGYENYTALLGDVDYEQPTPAVVREGNLAPYRDAVWFTEPTAAERIFLDRNDELLAALVANTLGSQEGRSFLHHLLRGSATDLTTEQLPARIGEAFAADYALAESAAGMLRIVAPDDPLLTHLPAADLLLGDGELRLLARFLLEHVLPDPSRATDWNRARRTLADFGYALTDRGIRRARGPMDAILASSAAKDTAVTDILAHELAAPDGDRVRAVVVCDFAEQGHRAGRGTMRAGALRCFDAIVADPRLAGMMPVMVTANHLRVPSGLLTELLPRLRDLLGVAPEPGESPGDVTELTVPGVSRSAVLAAVSRLIGEGFVRVLVGTRGLLGEGWDCPAANTLIDLTTASTSSASQQLRGRTLRLDPDWPEKVAHNWTVTTVLPGARTDAALSDLTRTRKKLAAQWGVRLEGEPLVVRGAEHALTDAQRAIIRDIRAGTADRDAATALTAETLRTLEPRAQTRQRWRLGEPFAGDVGRSVVTGARSPRAVLIRPTLERALGETASTGTAIAGAFGVASGMSWFALQDPTIAGVLLAVAAVSAIAVVRPWRSLLRYGRDRRGTERGTRQLAEVVRAGLVGSGRIPAGTEIAVSEVDGSLAVRVTGGTDAQQRLFSAAIVELRQPVRTPRYLLEVDRGESDDPLTRLALRLAARREPEGVLLPVPTEIGRRRAGAEAFVTAWREHIGPARLHEVHWPEDAALLTRARRRSAPDGPRPFLRETWS
ncbi:DEAD/DEAH box helicase family protein [Microbacterium gorillae]|uniref:DEAD/DEAH box helicase family protein n=1 Tax=Microbacterium gorillae TaxID=1231063 RepID=UPI000694DE54|nr:DEAD/DEAH box helicase family protein [Microbacterium gorillae]